MDCRRVRELLPLYADGELDGAREAQVSAHLPGCPACRERAGLDRELAEKLAAFMPAEGLAARRTALRAKVLGQVEKERRWQPWRRAALQLGNTATWAMMLAVTGVLVLAIAVTWRPLAERAWRGQASLGTPTPAGIGWHVVKDDVIADYYWAVDPLAVDRTPQLSPDGSKIAYLPTVDGQATDLDRLVVRDLGTGKDLDLTPEEGYSYASVRWSPDSKTLAFVKYRGNASYPTLSELWRVDAGGGNLARLYAAQDDAVAETRGRGLVIDGWSADGRSIDVQVTALLSSYMGRERVRADGSGSEERAYPTAADMGVEEGALVGREVFSPAGDFFLHAVKTAGLLEKPEGAPADGQSLVLYDFVSKRSTILGSFADAIQLSDGDVSPDGEWISFVTVASIEGEGTWQPGTLWVVRRDGTGLRQVMLNGEPAPADMPGPLWAAGGRAYFNQPPWVSAIWICAVDAASGETGLITHRFPAHDLVSVSRDGRRLLIIRGEGQSAKLCLLTLAPKPAPTPTVELGEQDTAGLMVEEHAVATEATGFPTDLEGTGWIDLEVLKLRQAWREPAPAKQVAAANEALRPFGLRLEPKEKPPWVQPFYDLYKGDRVVLADLRHIWPVAVSAAGDDFALLVEPLTGGYQLLRPTGSEEWDSSQHQNQPPVFVGQDLVSVTGVFELCSVTVWRGSVPVYTSSFEGCGATYPVKGLWSWQGHWVLEASGRVVMDGQDLNQQLGYDEIFGYRLLEGRPFYFFTQGGRVGVSYDGVTLPQQYDEVLHYGCCSAAAYNPGGNDTMTWFFGLRDGTWYYVEMGRYDAEEAPAPAGGWEASVELQPLDASGGALYGRLVLTNRSQEARTLEGRPQATIVDGTREKVPTIVGEGWDGGSSTPVTVQPGEQAVARIIWANYCGQAPAEPLSLVAILPGPEAVQLTVPLKLVGGLPRCSVEAPTSTLTVGPFESAEAPPAVTPTPGAADAAFSTFLPAAAAYLERPMQSPEAISAEAIVARDLQELMRQHGLAPLYVQRSEGELEAWGGAGVAGSETGAFLLWHQGDRVAYQFYSGEYAYFLYLVNPPQTLRLVERDGALEMGLITAPIGSTGDVWFVLLRLMDGKWVEVWSPSQVPDGSWQSAGPASVEFTGPGIDSLRVLGPIPADVTASRVFFEFGVYLKQSYESTWQRLGDGYARVSGRIRPTPLTTLADFIAALQKGDRAGAAALATDAGVVDAALGLGLDVPASGEGWLATEEDAQAGEAGRIRFFDSEKRDRSYAAALAQKGGEWRVSAVERIAPVLAADATPAPQAGPGAFRALHMVDARTGWALAERAVLRTSDGGATWEEALPWWREGGGGEAASSSFIGGSFFLDGEHAWVAWGSGAGASTGARLTVEYTADGGRNWQSSLLPLEGMGAQLSFVDARRGWLLLHQGGAAGSEGVAVLGTLDGGGTWKVLSASDPQSPQPGQVPFVGSKDGISFRDAASGWLPLFEPVSGKFLLYVTHDGGHTWAEQALALPDGYEEAQATPEAPVFFSAQEGVLAVGIWRHEPSRLFYVTHDGGATWSPMVPVDAAVGGSVVSEFVSVDEGWALVAPVPGETRKLELRHTTDGGKTWTALTSDAALEGVTALDFVDSDAGWALCTGEESTYVLKTRDGGATWARVAT